MSIVAKVGAAMQVLFGTIAEEAGKKTGVIVRQRKFTCISLAKTFVLGFLQKPNAWVYDTVCKNGVNDEDFVAELARVPSTPLRKSGDFRYGSCKPCRTPNVRRRRSGCMRECETAACTKVLVRGLYKVKCIALWYALAHNLWRYYALKQAQAAAGPKTTAERT